jgi:hypothetical protein
MFIFLATKNFKFESFLKELSYICLFKAESVKSIKKKIIVIRESKIIVY